MTDHHHTADDPDCWDPSCGWPAIVVEAITAPNPLAGYWVAPDGYGTETIWHGGTGAYDVPVAVLRRNQIADRNFWTWLVAQVGGAA